MVETIALALIIGGALIAAVGMAARPKRVRSALAAVGIIALVAGVAIAAGLLNISSSSAAAPQGEGIYSVLFAPAASQHIGGAAAESAVVSADQHNVKF